MQIDVPAERRDHRDDAMERSHVRHATKMAYEIETAATKTAVVELAEAALGDAIVDTGDRAKRSVAHRNGIQCHAIVCPMHAGIDDDGSSDAELGVQDAQIFQRRVRRCIGPSWRIRIFVAGTEDVRM